MCKWCFVKSHKFSLLLRKKKKNNRFWKVNKLSLSFFLVFISRFRCVPSWTFVRNVKNMMYSRKSLWHFHQRECLIIPNYIWYNHKNRGSCQLFGNVWKVLLYITYILKLSNICGNLLNNNLQFSKVKLLNKYSYNCLNEKSTKKTNLQVKTFTSTHWGRGGGIIVSFDVHLVARMQYTLEISYIFY